MRPTLIIESPYTGDIQRNLEFASNMCEAAVVQRYAPFASHMFYTLFMDDDDPEERTRGMQCGFSWGRFATEIWFCVREIGEFSRGMQDALVYYSSLLHQPTIMLVKANQDGLIEEMICLNLTSRRELLNLLMGTSSIPSGYQSMGIGHWQKQENR